MSKQNRKTRHEGYISKNRNLYTIQREILSGRKTYYPVVQTSEGRKALMHLPFDTAREAVSASIEWVEPEDAALTCAPDMHLEEIYEERTQYEPDFGDLDDIPFNEK